MKTLIFLLLGLVLFSCNKINEVSAEYTPPSNYKYINSYKLGGYLYIYEVEIDSVRYLVTVSGVYGGNDVSIIKK